MTVAWEMRKSRPASRRPPNRPSRIDSTATHPQTITSERSPAISPKVRARLHPLAGSAGRQPPQPTTAPSNAAANERHPIRRRQPNPNGCARSIDVSGEQIPADQQATDKRVTCTNAASKLLPGVVQVEATHSASRQFNGRDRRSAVVPQEWFRGKPVHRCNPGT